MSHTGHILLVEADSIEDAISSVEGSVTYADTPNPDWSDWHAIGGRWDDVVEGNALGYEGNEERFMEIINQFLDYRTGTMQNLLEQLEKENHDFASAVDAYTANVKMTIGLSNWRAMRLAQLLENYWTSDSHVYDLEAYTAGLGYFYERLEKDPSRQFLVVVDFHF